MFCAFEALCMAKFFDNSGVGLAKVYGFFVGYYPAFFDDLFVQFIVGWIGYVFFLYRCVYTYYKGIVGIFRRFIYTKALCCKINSTPGSPMRWRKAVSSVGTQGMVG